MGNVFARCVGTTTTVRDVDKNVQQPTSTTLSMPMKQPVLSPTEWFLTQDEMTKARAGVARSDLALFTSNSNVTTFPSTDVYYKTLLHDLQDPAVQCIWISGWSLNHLMPLDPTATNFAETSLKSVIEQAVDRRGVHVRALVWTNLFLRKECLATRDWMNTVKSTSGGSALMLFDNRLPHHVSSHHQKCVVLKKRSGEYVAFMGGVDITLDRWDTLAHDEKLLRESRGLNDGSDGWIDASVRLEGPAARDVAATFAARWNSSVQSAECVTEDLLDFENPDAYDSVPTPPPPPSAPTDQSKGVAVQVVRTFSPHKSPNLYPEFASRGELSLLASRVKAISLAKNFVYIEDQYFFFMPQLMEAIDAALQRGVQVLVVVQRPTVTTQSRYAGYEKLVFLMARPLLDKYPNQFLILTTKLARNLYIHSKVQIIDDVFLSISSANWNRRSATSDTELGASIVDTTLVTTADNIQVGAVVYNFRLAKLSEKTGLSIESLASMKVGQVCEALANATKQPHTIVDVLDVEAKWEFAMFPHQYSVKVVDPDDVNDADSDSDDGK